MKSIGWIAAAAALLLTSTAMAQMPPSGGPGSPGGPGQPGGPGMMGGGMMMAPGPHGGPHGRPMHHRGHWGPPPPPTKAAHFRFRHGKARIDVKCADDEPMKACVDATIRLLDKLQSMKQQGQGGQSGSGGGSQLQGGGMAPGSGSSQ